MPYFMKIIAIFYFSPTIMENQIKPTPHRLLNVEKQFFNNEFPNKIREQFE
jgi:hypothetical protein